MKPSITDMMRYNLAPKGRLPLSYLNLTYKHFDHSFILKCIDELDKMPMRIELDDPPSNLEKLAFMLLCDSAHIEVNRDL